MAKPRMRFTVEQASDLVKDLARRLHHASLLTSNVTLDIDFQHGGPDAPARQALQALRARVAAAATRHGVNAVPLSADFPDDVKGWICTHMTDTGWRRLQARLRQNKAQRLAQLGTHGQRLKPVDMPESAANGFGLMAEGVGLERSQLLGALATWLQFDKKGSAALAVFTASALQETLQRAWMLLGSAFKLTPAQAKVLFSNAVVETSEHRVAEMGLLVLKAGKLRLSKLRRALQPWPASEHFGRMVAPLPELGGQCLLQQAAEGKLDEALTALQQVA